MYRLPGHLAWLLILACASAWSAPPPPPDTRIVIDISGSMKKNDPRNLRRPAVRLLVGLLPAHSRAGIWTFGQYVNMQVPLGKVDQRWRDKARKGAAKIHSRGLYTDIEAAIKRATGDWKGPAGDTTRHLILLTDGMVDVSKDPAESQRSRQRVLAEQLPLLRDLGVKVHTVALSARADHELMRRLSNSTGGWYEQVDSAAALQKVFLRLFEKVGNPDTLPLKDNRFRVDNSIRELTLIVFRPEGANPTRVTMPDDQSFDRASAPGNVAWHQDEGYDLLTVQQPMAGDWSIQAQVDPDNRVMILTDLRMETTAMPNRIVSGQRIPLTVSFESEGKIINRREFIDVMNLSAEQIGPSGLSTEPRPMADDGQGDDPLAYDGRFEIRFSPQGEQGRGELLINAEGKTFQRQKRMLFELVQPATAELKPDADSGLLSLSVKPDSEIIDPATAEISAELQDATGNHTSVALETTPEGTAEAQIDPGGLAGKVSLTIRVRARSRAGDTVGSVLPVLELEGKLAAPEKPAAAPEPSAPEPPETPTESEDPAVSWLIWFGAANLGLLVIGGLTFWLIRRRGKKDVVVLVDGDEAAEEEGEKNDAGEKPAKAEAKA